MIIQWPKEANGNRQSGLTAKLFEAHNNAQNNAQNRKRSSLPKIGTVRLSNTDSLRTALDMRRRVLAKLAEVAAVTDVDKKTRDAMVATVKMQLDKVDRQITAIKRRERAVKEERTARRDECPRARRRRQHDMKERSVNIRRDMLFPADKGGFDPRNPAGFPVAAVSFNFGGTVGMAMDAPAPAAAMEVVL
jgi:hypothetical protein